MSNLWKWDDCLNRVLAVHISDNDNNNNAIIAQSRVVPLIFRNSSRALVIIAYPDSHQARDDAGLYQHLMKQTKPSDLFFEFIALERSGLADCEGEEFQHKLNQGAADDIWSFTNWRLHIFTNWLDFIYLLRLLLHIAGAHHVVILRVSRLEMEFIFSIYNTFSASCKVRYSEVANLFISRVVGLQRLSPLRMSM